MVFWLGMMRINHHQSPPRQQSEASPLLRPLSSSQKKVLLSLDLLMWRCHNISSLRFWCLPICQFAPSRSEPNLEVSQQEQPPGKPSPFCRWHWAPDPIEGSWCCPELTMFFSSEGKVHLLGEFHHDERIPLGVCEQSMKIGINRWIPMMFGFWQDGWPYRGRCMVKYDVRWNRQVKWSNLCGSQALRQNAPISATLWGCSMLLEDEGLRGLLTWHSSTKSANLLFDLFDLKTIFTFWVYSCLMATFSNGAQSYPARAFPRASQLPRAQLGPLELHCLEAVCCLPLHPQFCWLYCVVLPSLVSCVRWCPLCPMFRKDHNILSPYPLVI